MTTKILFLFFPVFFGGLCLLLGETFNWYKKRQRREKGPVQTTLFSHLKK